MKKIEQLRLQRDKVQREMQLLRTCLLHYERAINNLLASEGKTLENLSIKETMHIANLLIEMYEEVD